MMDILEAIRTRTSVRTYDGRALDAAERASVLAAIKAESAPFGGSYEIRLHSFSGPGEFRPGTYGVIRGASDYLMMAYDDSSDAARLSAGYAMEGVVLRATAIGLGTCWIAATFRGTDFARACVWPDGMPLKIVSPIGHPAGRRFIERVMRMGVGSDRRKPFGTLFFDGEPGRPLSAAASCFGESLDMLRLAPSSTNSQPWRAVVAGGSVHLYCMRKGALSVLDCGIALRHLYEAETAAGHAGAFYRDESAPRMQGADYLTSYRRI